MGPITGVASGIAPIVDVASTGSTGTTGKQAAQDSWIHSSRRSAMSTMRKGKRVERSMRS